MKKILISYFEPFGEEKENSSELAVNAYFKQYPEMKTSIVAIKLPTTFKDSANKLIKSISSENPDIILMFGQAMGRKNISIERVAVNIIDARIPDNEGEQPIDKPVIPGGKNAYFSSLPVRKIKDALEEKNIPVSISYSAGTYVCNYLFYSVMHFIEYNKLETRAGFVHLPLSSSQIEENSDKPSLSQQMLVDGLNEIIKVCDS
ncbi:MAG: pyroglutamyl-peptidase I [Thermotogota bacterium]|nr:pyroglutamyl-peptidase I [Thermotogota bacterium]